VGKKVYVGNLSYDVTDSDLNQLFEPHGTVVFSQVIMDRNTGRSKGFGFVEMGSDEEAQTAIAALNGQDHNGRPLNVDEARERPQRSGGRGGYGGGRGGYGGGRGGGRSRW
jgi:RNA recognition motif-containing protein